MADSPSVERKGGSGSASSKKLKLAHATATASAATAVSATERAAKAQRKAQRAEAAAAALQQTQQIAPAHSGGEDDDHDGGEDSSGDNAHNEEQHPLHSDEPEDEEEDLADVSTPEGMQAMLVLLMQQQKQAKAAAKAERAQDRALIAQLQQQLQQQAISTGTLRLGTSLSGGVPAPAARSTLKTEAGTLAQQQAAATVAAAPASMRDVQQRAAEARAPSAPGVQAAALAAPPRRDLPKVKQELEAVSLSKDPTLLKAWVFQMERLLRAMEQGSMQAFTFGDRLSVAQDHWDAGMEAWWTSLCDARATAALPAVCSWAGLLAALHETYAPVADGLMAAREMHQIKQGAAESMEAFVRRVLELQGRIPPGRLPSHVVGDLALNGVDESRFPWTLSIVRGEAMGYANTQPSGQGPDMAFIAHRLRTQAVSEPKVMRGAGSSNSAELTSMKAELAKMQRQLAQNTQVTHMAALYTAGGNSSSSSTPVGGASSQGSSSMGKTNSSSTGTWRSGARGRGQRVSRGGGAGNRQPLDDAELTRRYEAGQCFECGEVGHIGRDCPKRAARKQQQQQQNERGAEGAPSSEN